MFVPISLKIITNIFFDSIVMLRFGETKITKEKFYAAKKTINIWNVNVDNMLMLIICQSQN